MPIRRLLVANRGEIACRILRAARKLGIETVAVASEPDRDGLHTQLADHVVEIGPARPAESYLSIDRLLHAAHVTGADAVHPGYGFLAEQPRFAAAVEAAGLVFVGPTPSQIADMGDKERARRLAGDAGLWVLPGSRRFASATPLEPLAEEAGKIGYPLLVKATAGGGGIGMRRVDNEDQLRQIAPQMHELAARAFSTGEIYFERYVARARHIEVQIFGLGDGRVVHFGERECSVQRRFQKVIEEAPAPRIFDDMRRRLCDAASRLAERLAYTGAGTVEFIVDESTNDFYFLEMNTRIQVEHPVTEMVWGVDLVELQLRLAGGEDLSGELFGNRSPPQGHAVECRLCAEDPARGFLPSPGVLRVLLFPEQCDSVRIETGYRQGDTITTHYDPLLAKIICHGPTRQAAISTMRNSIAAIQVEGLQTNRDLLAAVLDHKAFRKGQMTTHFLEDHSQVLVGNRNTAAN